MSRDYHHHYHYHYHHLTISTNLTPPPPWRYVALGVRPGPLRISAVRGSYSAYKLVWRILITLREELLPL